jgi:uncharacterized protein YbaR (Trm112 family)
VAPLDERFLEVIVCPKCKGDLHYHEDRDALDCNNCALRYRVEEGIPVLLISEASPLDIIR